jgi:hypothetical protein
MDRDPERITRLARARRWEHARPVWHYPRGMHTVSCTD